MKVRLLHNCEYGLAKKIVDLEKSEARKLMRRGFATDSLLTNQQERAEEITKAKVKLELERTKKTSKKKATLC